MCADIVSMRRESDICALERTGVGRRARDRLLSGDMPAGSPRSEVDNLMWSVGDDLQAAALALGGIERFLVEVQERLGASEISADDLAAFTRDADLDARVASLDAGLAQLAVSLARLSAALPR